MPGRSGDQDGERAFAVANEEEGSGASVGRGLSIHCTRCLYLLTVHHYAMFACSCSEEVASASWKRSKMECGMRVQEKSAATKDELSWRVPPSPAVITHPLTAHPRTATYTSHRHHLLSQLSPTPLNL